VSAGRAAQLHPLRGQKTCFNAASYQGTASAVPMSRLFMIRRTDFSPCGACSFDFFRDPFSPDGKTRRR